MSSSLVVLGAWGSLRTSVRLGLSTRLSYIGTSGFSPKAVCLCCVPLLHLQSSKMSASSSPPGVFTLNNSRTIPAIGLGTYDTAHEDVEAQRIAVLKALQAGYRHIDTASAYQTETAIGAALKEAFASGLVKREDVFVTTKIFSTQLHIDQILPSIKASLSNLQLEYVDLYLIHWPYRLKPGAPFNTSNRDDYLPLDIKKTWEELEKLVELGLAKSIGVSNFYVKVLKELLSVAKIPPAVNQIELHPQWQQDKVRAYCKKNNIHVSAWSPIGAPGASHALQGALDNPILKDIAARHGKSVPQISLRWEYEIGVSALPKSFNEKRMTENFDIWNFSLTEEDHKKIQTIGQSTILNNPVFVQFHGTPWRTFDEFWDNEE